MTKNFLKYVNDKDQLNSRSLVESCNYNPVVDHLPSIHKTTAISSNINIKRKLNKEILTPKPSS